MAKKTQWVTVLACILAGFGGGLLAGLMGHLELANAVQAQAHPTILEASEFRVVDKEGRVRAVLGMDSALLSYLRLLDLEGHTRVSLSISAFLLFHGMH